MVPIFNSSLPDMIRQSSFVVMDAKIKSWDDEGRMSYVHPHPSPLPWGEGMIIVDLPPLGEGTQVDGNLLPLPMGEGWGEGDASL